MASENGRRRLRTCGPVGTVVLVFASGLLLAEGVMGCVVIGASSRGGFFIWPGGLGLLLLVVVLALVLRRR